MVAQLVGKASVIERSITGFSVSVSSAESQDIETIKTIANKPYFIKRFKLKDVKLGVNEIYFSWFVVLVYSVLVE